MTSNNSELIARREVAVPRAIASAFPIYVDRSDNSELWDVEGKRYIDFAGGIAVLNTGHRHPKVMKAVEAQLQRFSHTCFQVAPYDSYVELAERLNRIVPVVGDAGDVQTAFFSTGAEANENALKIARYATRRSAFVSFAGAFHGRTMMTLAVTGKVAAYKAGFGPMMPEVFHAPFPVSSQGISVQQSLDALHRIFAADVDPQRVAGIIVEPVQGEGGFHVAPPEFLRELRMICDTHGILLIADEIQTGFARTGRMFAMEHSGVKPDIITMAKSLAAGFPLSAISGRKELMSSIPPGGLGSTYAGHPLACVAGLAVLDIIENEKLCERAESLGRYLMDSLRDMESRNDISSIGDVRGIGSMVALELVEQRDIRKPAPAVAKAVIAEAERRGLLLLSCGPHGNALRFLYPLTIPQPLFEEGVEVLKDSLLSASRNM